MKTEQGKRNHRRYGVWDDDPAKGAQVGTTVYASSIDQIARDVCKELAQQENAQRIGDPRDDERLIAVHPVECLHLQIERNGDHLEGHNRRAQKEREERAPSWELELGKRVGRHRIDHQAARGYSNRYKDAV